jgi:uncharacterized protein
MKIQLESGLGQNLIHSYGPGKIRIGQEVHVHSLIVTPARIIADWPPASFEELAAIHFQQIADLAPEVVILGTGARLRFPPPAVTRALIEVNVGVEVMDTGAACRTYNFLASDGRRVIAALLMI